MNPIIPLPLLFLFLTLNLSNAQPCITPALRCGCYLTLRTHPRCQPLLHSHPNPCASFTRHSKVDKSALLAALRRTLRCRRAPFVTRQSLETLSPAQERAILERIRGMVLAVLRMLNMGRSVEPGFRMVVGAEGEGEGWRRMKVMRLVQYNQIG